MNAIPIYVEENRDRLSSGRTVDEHAYIFGRCSQADLPALGDPQTAIAAGPDLNGELGEADEQGTVVIADADHSVGERGRGGVAQRELPGLDGDLHSAARSLGADSGGSCPPLARASRMLPGLMSR